MNRTGIEYLELTWNPVVGCKGVKCAVRLKCWARGMAKRQRKRCLKCYDFKPHFHKERLYEPLHRKKPSRIGVCFMGDFFDTGVLREWRTKILNVIRASKQHIFFILTKQPQNAVGYELPRNLIFGVSVNSKQDLWRVYNLRKIDAFLKAISFEPLYEHIPIDLTGINWIIIGGQTKPSVLPRANWVYPLINQAKEKGVSVFLKNNLGPSFSNSLKEYPVGVSARA